VTVTRRDTHRRARRIPRKKALQFRGAGDVRGYADVPGGIPPVAWGLGAFALLALAFSGRKGIVEAGSAVVDFAKEQAFKLALPSGIGQWSSQIITAANKYRVDPWVLAGIMQNESLGGSALKPPGPAGTGDFIPRQSGNLYFKYANPATGMPPDGLGWGRGLMQVDYGAHNAWVIANNWRDPQVNISKGAEILRWNLDYFASQPGAAVAVEAWRISTGKPEYGIQPWAVRYPRAGAWPTSVPDARPLSGTALYEAAIAGYNVSIKGVLQALGLGLPAEAGTTRQNYVTTFLTKIAAWQAKFTP
jgi:hypothetical protein